MPAIRSLSPRGFRAGTASARRTLVMDRGKPFAHLYDALKAGRISRRQFLQQATAFGMSAAVAGFVIKSIDMKSASAQDAPATRPSAGFENATRGQGDELKLLVWQAPTL